MCKLNEKSKSRTLIIRVVRELAIAAALALEAVVDVLTAVATLDEEAELLFMVRQPSSMQEETREWSVWEGRVG